MIRVLPIQAACGLGYLSPSLFLGGSGAAAGVMVWLRLVDVGVQKSPSLSSRVPEIAPGGGGGTKLTN
jgi:hypothetical protein